MTDDCISRKEVLDKIYNIDGMEALENSNIFAKHYADMIKSLPSVTPKEKTGHRRLTNPEWIGFLSEQFDISRTSAKEMLHAMMSVKKEDNFKKQFSQRNKGFSQGFSQVESEARNDKQRAYRDLR